MNDKVRSVFFKTELWKNCFNKLQKIYQYKSATQQKHHTYAAAWYIKNKKGPGYTEPSFWVVLRLAKRTSLSRTLRL